MRSCKELNVNNSMIIQNLKKIGKVKNLIRGCHMSWPQIKKNSCFEMSSLILHYNNKAFLDCIVMCDKKWISYDNREWLAQWLDWEEPSKQFPKPNLHQKKGHCHWWSAAGLIQYSFLNPGKTVTSEQNAQQIDEMHQKLKHLQPA